MVLGKLIRSAIAFISRKALIKARSELLIVRLFWYFDTPNPSNDASPRPGPIVVDKSEPFNNGFSGPPTRDGSTPAFSLLNVLHSEPTSITL